MEKMIAGKPIQLNDEGFMTNFAQWDESVGREIAKENNIDLSPKHMEVINYLQQQYKAEIPLTIRKVGQSGVVTIKEFYELFPLAPLKTSTKIAGIPKPASCI